MEKKALPIAFIHQMERLLPAGELPLFLDSILNTPPVTAVRLNPRKGANIRIDGTPVPWSQGGITLERRPNFTLDPLFHTGAYYVQESSSMLVEWITRRLLRDTPTPFILDLAAAPGGKSTILAEIAFERNGFLLANEVIKSRIPVLKQNLAKWGYSHVFVSSLEIPVFNVLPPLFDLILLDAPCSGEGLFRKDPRARDEWSPEQVNHCASRQKRILAPIPGILKEGGYLIYSTCTFNQKENDDQMSRLCREYPMEVVPIDPPQDWGIVKTEKGGLQCFPHKVHGEGFYLAVLQLTGPIKPNVLEKNTDKSSGKKMNFPESISAFMQRNHDLRGLLDPVGNYYGIPEAIYPAFQLLDKSLPFLEPILLLGNIKGNSFIPEPQLALSFYPNPELPVWKVDRYDALIYLKKEISSSKPSQPGWGLIRYEDLNLGWYKGVGERYNNYHPKPWRILMSIPDRVHLPELPFNVE
jgi:16S rRNA C967 or C1407 C5-methylase (RsmB/RsmF family)